jgi:hypothetical protein
MNDWANTFDAQDAAAWDSFPSELKTPGSDLTSSGSGMDALTASSYISTAAAGLGMGMAIGNYITQTSLMKTQLSMQKEQLAHGERMSDSQTRMAITQIEGQDALVSARAAGQKEINKAGVELKKSENELTIIKAQKKELAATQKVQQTHTQRLDRAFGRGTYEAGSPV